MCFKKTKGFTLVEILTVIIIIFILIGLLFPALTKVREQSMIKQAEAMIGSLEVAINMYYTDFGSYPSESGWGSLLVNGSGGYGPYMDSENYNTTSGNFEDPWGNAYQYDASSPPNNSSTFDVWSSGTDDTGDIGNW